MHRLKRKDEHLLISMSRMPVRADFSDINFMNNCLPDMNFSDINLETDFLGRTLSSPFYFNAVTGGTKNSFKINAELASIAKELDIPMAVGSQMIAIKDRTLEDSFKVIRKVNPKGIIYANIGSYATPEIAYKAVDMIDADALQVHLNVPQELFMHDGNTNFSGMLDRITKIKLAVDVPVIVKEVGFGIASEQAALLEQISVDGIDVGGKGGTNFIRIESARSKIKNNGALVDWGIPTPISLIEVLNRGNNLSYDVSASGGMFHAMDMAKALALGAAASGMAAYPVFLLLNRGYKYLLKRMKRLKWELKAIMMMTGVGTIKDLQKVPLIITGFTAEWMMRRGIDPNYYANKR